MTQLGRWKNLPPSCFFVISLDSYSAPAGFLWRGVPLYHAQTAPEVPPEGVFNPKNAAIPHKARSINGYCTHTNERRMELLPPCVVFLYNFTKLAKKTQKNFAGVQKTQNFFAQNLIRGVWRAEAAGDLWICAKRKITLAKIRLKREKALAKSWLTWQSAQKTVCTHKLKKSFCLLWHIFCYIKRQTAKQQGF